MCLRLKRQMERGRSSYVSSSKIFLYFLLFLVPIHTSLYAAQKGPMNTDIDVEEGSKNKKGKKKLHLMSPPCCPLLPYLPPFSPMSPKINDANLDHLWDHV